ncbi:hypothetical protein ACFE04_002297 [Oxalis oulophora]
MSKKKASSGNTMTLKDFHGGSIPSDLPLPSAPGVVVRPITDRVVGFDRPTPWINRSDTHRTRPTSVIKNHFDDKTPFITHTPSHHVVGRNFDEDERKPLDGLSLPRRTVSDDTYKAPPPPSKVVGSGSVSPWSSVVENSYAGRVTEVAVISSDNNNNLVNGSRGVPNAWGVRKEVVNEPAAPEKASAVSKMAHASALDKVTSGRWLSSKSASHYQPDVDVNRYSEMESALHSKEYSEVKERKPETYKAGGVQHARADVGSEKQSATSMDSTERPKLKLLPRTKPSETIEPPVVTNQDYQWPKDFDHHGPLQTINELQGNMNPAKAGIAGNETGNQAIERPKLNIKPRSQPLESYVVGHPERERSVYSSGIPESLNSLFGGARPREAVLRERGVDDVVINTKNLDQHSDRIKPRTEKVAEHGVASRHSERQTSSVPVDQRNLKKTEKKDNNRFDVDTQWRNDTWRNNREHERTQRQQERDPSPQNWRKTVAEQPGEVGVRHGKAASAVDLALSFSKSHADTKTDDERYTGQKDQSDQAQKPFSRLMGPTQRSRHQINGY